MILMFDMQTADKVKCSLYIYDDKLMSTMYVVSKSTIHPSCVVSKIYSLHVPAQSMVCGLCSSNCDYVGSLK